MTRHATGVIVALCLASPARAGAQSVMTEVDLTAGRSTDGTTAAGTQVRLLGSMKSGWRALMETSWAGQWHNHENESDAFGTAYPYDGHVRPMEIYAERASASPSRLAILRAGRYRVPFGISGRSDFAYVGFTRAPLIRYGDNWALSNTFLDTGVDVLVGRPSLSVESSIGMSSDEGEYRRPHGLGMAVRGQVYAAGVIAGISYVRARPSMSGPFVKGAMRFSGVDARWMRGGVLMRGEWIDGRPFNGVATRGGYIDAIVHRNPMGPITALARVERLDYDAGPYSAYYRRVAAGARYQASRSIGVTVNVVHQAHGLVVGGPRTAVDASVTYTIRYRP